MTWDLGAETKNHWELSGGLTLCIALLSWQNSLDAQFLQTCLQPLETTPLFGLVCEGEFYPLRGLLHSRSTVSKRAPCASWRPSETGGGGIRGGTGEPEVEQGSCSASQTLLPSAHRTASHRIRVGEQLHPENVSFSVCQSEQFHILHRILPRKVRSASLCEPLALVGMAHSACWPGWPECRKRRSATSCPLPNGKTTSLSGKQPLLESAWASFIVQIKSRKIVYVGEQLISMWRHLTWIQPVDVTPT